MVANSIIKFFKSEEHDNVFDYTHKLQTKITKLFNQIDADDISSEVITITINDESVIFPLEFIDLPGIRTFPNALAQKTSALCESYINLPNVIILCAVPAITPRL